MAAPPPGYVVSVHALSGGAALPSAAKNQIVVYHTRTADGRDAIVSGTIAIPKGSAPSGGWPVISWAHGTTGDAPQCAPSHFSKPNGEQRMLDAWVARGYAVVQTDYDGIGEPGVHEYFSGAAATHDVTDIVRAARSVDPQIGNRWVVMGHSEGGNAALFASALAPAWAPDLHLLGAVSYAPGVNIVGAVQGAVLSTQPMSYLPLEMMMVDGMAASDPHLDPSTFLTPLGLQRLSQLHTRCIDDLLTDSTWQSTIPSSLFQHGTQLTPLFEDLMKNDSQNLKPAVPVLMLQGTNDILVDASTIRDLASKLCANGGNVAFIAVNNASHASILQQALPQSQSWVAARFAGTPAPPSCPKLSS